MSACPAWERDMNVRCYHSPLQQLSADLGQSLVVHSLLHYLAWSYYEATLSFHILISTPKFGQMDIGT